ncbi:TonB-dependent receptor [Kordiimonas sp.]|uniref:TonB-dependent receptor n=1 Tax=Kordiimonas sp. TaxID=1970157 RepID=UPI003A902331
MKQFSESAIKALKMTAYAHTKNALRSGISLATLTGASAILPGMANAQDSNAGDFVFEEIVVTAQKRSQNLQEVPVSISVLNQSTLEQRNIQSFADYAAALPSVSFLALGPGQSEVFFRGLSDGGNGNPAGTAPSAAIYLDEQPVTTIGSNLDIQVYDVARIEALSGPQSTLFGASSETGTLRIVTNAPDVTGFAAGFDVSGHSVKDGGEGYSLEGFVNVPLNDSVALRVVGWQVENAGYIDNVAATRTFTRSGITVDNAAFAEEDFNTEKKTGARAALGIDLNDNWTATIRGMYQDQRTQGVFDHDPDDVGDLEVERFFEDSYSDEFMQFSGTLEGKVGDLNLVYSGSYLDRDIQYVNDYSEYAEYSAFIDYYTCEYAYSYVSYGYEFFNCNDPRIQFENDSKFTRQTHEFRLLSDEDQRLRFLVGFFYDRQELDYIFEYRIPQIQPGFAISFSPGTASDAYFVTDQNRVDKQIAGFGEIEYDINDSLTATFGYRYSETKTSLNGFVGTVFTASPAVDVSAKDTQSLFKANLTYTINDDFLTYATFSQGFRPGGANRAATSNIPLTYAPDTVDNYEIGWKSSLLDGRIRLNGAAFYMKWQDIQLTRFDPSESPLGLTNNAGDARAMGVEVDFSAYITEEFSLNGGFVFLDAELTDDFTQNVSAPAGTPADAPAGTGLPFAPGFKGSLTARYETDTGIGLFFAQADASYVDTSYNDLFVASRQEQDSYGILNLSTGIQRDQWTVTLEARNITDTRAQIYRNATDFDSRITTNRPRTLFISLGYKY